MSNNSLIDPNDTNLLLSARIEDKDVKVRLGNLIFTWEGNYERFLKKAFSDSQWKQEILRTIAKNDEWYNEIQKFRNEK